MTTKLPPRRPLDPLLLPPAPVAPPAARSRQAIGLAVAAASGRFALQVCVGCGAVQYPPREACHRCLDTRLVWRDVPPRGEVIAETVVRASADAYVRPRLPWRIATIRLDAGPSVIAHLHGDVHAGDRARMALRLDKSGQGVMLALPLTATPAMEDDPILRELGCSPKERRILLTDGRGPFAAALGAALLAAGAKQVFAGIADPWLPGTPESSVGLTPIPLDPSDETSVRVAAAEFGGRVEIVIDTALRLRPGAALGRAGTVTAREEIEAALLGPMRLSQAFGPALRARAAEGPYAPCAWLTVVSVYALAAPPEFAATAPAQAARLALVRGLRAELRPLHVGALLVGPLDDAWHAALPAPKVSPAHLAAAVLRALDQGLEEVAVGDVAADLLARWRDDPAILARELSQPSN